MTYVGTFFFFVEVVPATSQCSGKFRKVPLESLSGCPETQEVLRREVTVEPLSAASFRKAGAREVVLSVLKKGDEQDIFY